jgi:formylglycine-generating enzyme required for sulfatase activity
MLALASPAVQSHVMFLRDSDEVTKDMAERPAGQFKYRRLTPRAALPKHPWDGPDDLDEIGDFWIDCWEVRNSEYEDFLQSLFLHPQWFDGKLPVGMPIGFGPNGRTSDDPDFPVVGVLWSEAVLYANWAGKRLPTDREWERAAEGADDRKYPWGDTFEPSRVDLSHSILTRGSSPVPEGVIKPPPGHSAEGRGSVDDPRFEGGCTPEENGTPIWRLADNACEWVEDLNAILGMQGDPALAFESDFLRTLRGGGWLFGGEEHCSAESLQGGNLVSRSPYFGLRCVKSPYPGFAIR